jgi:hypothetical protein
MRTVRRRQAAPLSVALLSLALTGCAVLFNPSQQQVPVASDPQGAEVLVDGTLMGVTPITLELSGLKDYEVVLRLQGQERRIVLESKVSGTFVALDVLPGLALAGVSIALGEAWSAGAVDSFPELVVIVGSGLGTIAGVGSVAVNVLVDAATGRWRQLSPTAIEVTFE